MKNCPVNIKSPVQIQKWVCNSAHPVGCVEHDGFYYFNHVAGNTADPNIGVGNGSYSGGFTLCGLMTWLANEAIKAFHDEEYDAMLASFFSCLNHFTAGSEYIKGTVVVNNGVIFESLVDGNTADVSDASKWETYGTPCTILTSMKIDGEGNTVLGEDCKGNSVIAGASIATCDDLNSAISLLDERITTEVNTLNTRIDSEVQTLNQTIVDGDSALDDRIISEVNALNQTIVDGDSTLQSQIDANAACCITNAENIATNVQSIADNATSVAVNAANITSNANNVAANATQIAQNVQDISDNETAVAVNTTDISNLQSDVSNLETQTDANTDCCTTNSADINGLEADVSALQGEVQSNSTDIAVNTVNIANTSSELGTKQDKLQDCNGSDLAGQVPTCSQMNDAITDAVNNIPEPVIYKKCGGDDVDGPLVQCNQLDGGLWVNSETGKAELVNPIYYPNADLVRALPVPTKDWEKFIVIGGEDGGSFLWVEGGDCCTEEDGVYTPKTAGYVVKPSGYTGSGYFARITDGYIDPRAYGYKSGRQDNDIAINAALQRAVNCGGGTVHVMRLCDPVVSLASTLQMGANTRLLTDRGVEYKKVHGGSYLNNGLGYDIGTDIPAYSGNGDIIIEGGVWDGCLGDQDQFTHFAIGYAENVLIKDLVLANNIDAHHVDLCSSKNVRFERVTCIGQKRIDKPEYTFDMVQLDPNATLWATDSSSFPYFGKPTSGANINVTFDDCDFGPNPDKVDFNNAYVGIGSHSAVFDEYNTDIRVENCRFKEFQHSDIYAWKWNDLTVTDCHGTDGEMGLRLWSTPVGSESNKNRAGIDGGVPQAGSGYQVTNYTLERNNNTPIYTYAIDDAYPEVKYSNIHVQNLIIKDNVEGNGVTFNNVRDSSVHVGSAMGVAKSVVYFANCIDSTATVDSVKNSLRATRFYLSENCSSHVKAASRITGESVLNVQSCKDIALRYDTITDVDQRLVLVTTSSEGGTIHAGTSRDHCMTQPLLHGVVVQEYSSQWQVIGGVFHKTNSPVTVEDIQLTNEVTDCSTQGGHSHTGNGLVFNQAIGSNSLSTGIPHIGSPEGIVTAPLGSDVRDTSSGNIYRKASGAANTNTGWVAI